MSVAKLRENKGRPLFLSGLRRSQGKNTLVKIERWNHQKVQFQRHGEFIRDIKLNHFWEHEWYDIFSHVDFYGGDCCQYAHSWILGSDFRQDFSFNLKNCPLPSIFQKSINSCSVHSHKKTNNKPNTIHTTTFSIIIFCRNDNVIHAPWNYWHEWLPKWHVLQ